MNEILKMLPNTLETIWDSIRLNEQFDNFALNRVVNEQFEDLQSMYNFLFEYDWLTHEVYGEPEEDGFVFPFAVKKVKEGVKEYHGMIGDQTSAYHKETVTEHTAMVVSNFVGEHIASERLATIATLHDVGKKYTSGTNNKGEVCFYAHDTVSAYLAGRWLYGLYDDDEIKLIIAVIFAHMLPKTAWTEKPEKKEEFKKELITFFEDDEGQAETAMSLIERLSNADEGCATKEEVVAAREKIRRGERIISAF
jgi:hypothetical protein